MPGVMSKSEVIKDWDLNQRWLKTADLSLTKNQTKTGTSWIRMETLGGNLVQINYLISEATAATVNNT